MLKQPLVYKQHLMGSVMWPTLIMLMTYCVLFLTLVAGYMSLWIVFDQYLVLLQYSANKNTQKIEYLFYVWVRVTSFKIVQLAWVVNILRCRNGLFC